MHVRLIGCGAMGSALAHRWKEKGVSLSLYDQKPEAASKLAKELGCAAVHAPLEEISSQDILVIAIKPQDFLSALPSLKAFSGKLVISVMTGFILAELKKSFGCPVLRMMPNLAVRYGEGVVACMQDVLLEPLQNMLQGLLSSLGLVLWVPESLSDALTSLGGSGPAFVFSLIEGMIDAALAMGLSAEMGRRVAIQMMRGSLATLEATGKTPGELKWQVTSPGGTTIAGLRAFEECKVKSGVMETFLAAYERSRDLSK